MPEVIHDPSFETLVGTGLEIQRIADGFQFLEGPVWHERGRYLVFSDIPASRLYRWDEAGGVRLLRDPSSMANGNTLDRERRLLSCEHATSRLVREEADGSLTVLASEYDGKALNSPNDVIVDRAGRVFFTDPNYGRTHERVGVRRPQELPWQAVFLLEPSGRLTAIATDFQQPNGLCLDREERHLFVNDTLARHIRRWRIDGDRCSGGEVWAEVGGDGPCVPDGMKIDSAGTLFCTGGAGIQAFAPDGRCLGAIVMPEKTANFAWGDDDLKTLYVTASTSLYRIRVRVAGRPA
ncbi:MAG: SMP-30/gluconolactonase/LRE family protein [Lautropia sp.]